MKNRLIDSALPVALTAIIGFTVWIVSNGYKSELQGLTIADEQRITRSMREYSDSHYALLREDLAEIRAELSRISALQMEIVLRLSEKD